MAQDVGMVWMCCGVVPILFGWFLSVSSLHMLVSIRKTFLWLYTCAGLVLWSDPTQHTQGHKNSAWWTGSTHEYSSTFMYWYLNGVKFFSIFQACDKLVRTNLHPCMHICIPANWDKSHLCIHVRTCANRELQFSTSLYYRCNQQIKTRL